jgi:nicotinamide riboside transporter PnuC
MQTKPQDMHMQYLIEKNARDMCISYVLGCVYVYVYGQVNAYVNVYAHVHVDVYVYADVLCTCVWPCANSNYILISG